MDGDPDPVPIFILSAVNLKTSCSWRGDVLVIISVSDPHKFSCGPGSRIPKMSIWISGSKEETLKKKNTLKNFQLNQNYVKKTLKLINKI